jgi:histidinol-phosphate aminotransferase
MKPYGLSEFIRITVGTEAENQRFVKALGECMQDLRYA